MDIIKLDSHLVHGTDVICAGLWYMVPWMSTTEVQYVDYVQHLRQVKNYAVRQRHSTWANEILGILNVEMKYLYS